MAKASAEAGSTHYVAEGFPVPDDLPPDVRLVGPGAPQEQAPADPEPVPPSPAAVTPSMPPRPLGQAAPAGSEPPPLRAPKQDWVEHAVAAGAVAPEEAADMTKAEIVEQVSGAGG